MNNERGKTQRREWIRFNKVNLQYNFFAPFKCKLLVNWPQMLLMFNEVEVEKERAMVTKSVSFRGPLIERQRLHRG